MVVVDPSLLTMFSCVSPLVIICRPLLSILIFLICVIKFGSILQPLYSVEDDISKETGPVVNALALGAVQTEMLSEAFPGLDVPMTAANMADYIANFALKGRFFHNGKVLPVSNTTP